MVWTRTLIVAIFMTGLSAGLLLQSPALKHDPTAQPEVPDWSKSHELEDLDAERIAANYCFRAKRRILARAVTGRCTVDEAAIFFAVLDEANPTFNQKQFLKTYPGQSMDERYRQQVISWVRDWEKVKAAEAIELKH
jgi:hypothetical protein